MQINAGMGRLYTCRLVGIANRLVGIAKRSLKAIASTPNGAWTNPGRSLEVISKKLPTREKI
jgi:hypothetical protein